MPCWKQPLRDDDVQGNSSLPQGNLDTNFGEGVLFVTYSLLISGSVKGGSATVKVEGAAPDVMLRKGTRLHQIVQWLRNGDGDPLIVRFSSLHSAYPARWYQGRVKIACAISLVALLSHTGMLQASCVHCWCFTDTNLHDI